MSKSIFKSKTFYFNVLAFLVVLANAFGFGDFKANDTVLEVVAVLIPILNIVLRKITTQPVHL